ncbi:hypothetical protein D3C87_148390 [compost metagenome]
MTELVDKEGLTPEEKETLLARINDFIEWLNEKSIIKETNNIQHTFDLPWADEDWIMKVDIGKNKVSFNTFISDKCTFEYYEIVVLHEFFHLAVQKVPNKDDATKIKDDFGAELMKLIDIEADFYVALYLKERCDYTLVKYWERNREGAIVFIDRWIRAKKFERFLGTLLSITKMFLVYPIDGSAFSAYDLYLPTVSPIYTEDSLHVLIIKKEHIYFEEIKAGYQDFIDLKRCYQEVKSFSIGEYVETLIGISCKALNLEIPEKIKEEIDKIKSN